MTLRLTLSHHGSSHLEIGLAIDDDGHVTGHQTSGARVGRFARDLSADERTSLSAALEAAGAEPDPTTGAEPVEGVGAGAGARTPARPPSGGTEQLVADGLPDATFDSSADPPARFAELIAFLRRVREDLADSPLAALELDVSDSPLRARLRHVGSEPIHVRGGAELTCEVAAYDADYLIVDSAKCIVAPAGPDGALSPGWELSVLEPLEPAAPSGGFLSVHVGPVDVDSVGDGVFRRAEFVWVSQ